MLPGRFVHRSKMIMIFRFDCCFAKDLLQLVVTILKFFCLKVDWVNQFILIFILKDDEANNQREISSSHSHLWPTAITK